MMIKLGLSAVYAFSIVLPNLAVAQTLSDAKSIVYHCSVMTPNTAVGDCVVTETSTKFAELHRQACSPAGCVYKLQCKNNGRFCDGAGYSVEVGDSENGSRLTIKDLHRRISVYSQYGTCWTEWNYESGPLHGVMVLPADQRRHFEILAIPS
jgi:hypothetical protein